MRNLLRSLRLRSHTLHNTPKRWSASN
jgi:hypothetical protein